MSNDIHIWLTDKEAAAIKSLAAREDRSLTAMARALLREALALRKIVVKNG